MRTMKLKILIAVVMIVGLLAGVVPVLAATNSPSNGSGAASPSTENYIRNEEEMQGGPTASDVPDALLEASTSDEDTKAPSDELTPPENWAQYWCEKGNRDIKDCHPRGRSIVLRSGVITEIVRDENGEITRIT